MRFFERYGPVLMNSAMLGVVGFTVVLLPAMLQEDPGNIGDRFLGALLMFVAGVVVIGFLEHRTRDYIDALLPEDQLQLVKDARKKLHLLDELRLALGLKSDNGILPEIRALLKAVTESNLRVEQARSEGTQSRGAELRESKKLLEKRNSEVSKLQADLHRVRTELEACRAELTQLKSGRNELQHEVQSLKIFRTTAESLQLRISELEALCQKKDLACTESEQQVSQLEAKLAQITADRKQHEAECHRAVERCWAQEEEISRLHAERESGKSLNSTVLTLKENEQRLSLELLDLRAKRARDVTRLKQFDALEAAVAEAKRTATIREELLQSTLAECEAARRDLATLARKLESWGSEREALELSVRNSQEQLATLRSSFNAEQQKSLAFENERDRLMTIFELLAERHPEEVEDYLKLTD